MKKTGTDHRSRITKILIKKAFLELLKIKPIQSISIKELCELAEINRGTFYTHYNDIYALLNSMEDEMFLNFSQSLDPLLSDDSISLTPLKITTEIFKCLKDHSDLCSVILGDYGDKAFAFKLINYGREKCMEAYSKYFKLASQMHLEYFYAFASGGCISLLQKWIQEGMLIPAEDIAKMVEDIMLYGLGFLEKAH